MEIVLEEREALFIKDNFNEGLIIVVEQDCLRFEGDIFVLNNGIDLREQVERGHMHFSILTEESDFHFMSPQCRMRLHCSGLHDF